MSDKDSVNKQPARTDAFHPVDSPFGKLIIVSDGDAITCIKHEDKIISIDEHRSDELTSKAAAELKEYFSGKRRHFDLPLRPQGTTFQRSVWKALSEIPYGETRSYKQIAQAVGNPKACRAVGLANNKNPIWILIPCHRVIGSNGELTGYGGGLDMKKNLLESEKVNNEERNN